MRTHNHHASTPGSRFLAQFQRTGFKRPLAVMGAIAAAGILLRLWVVSQAKESFEAQEARKKERMQKSIDHMNRVHNPQIDWERVMEGVLEEEERIAREEEFTSQSYDGESAGDFVSAPPPSARPHHHHHHHHHGAQAQHHPNGSAAKELR